VRRPVTILDDPETILPSFDALFERVLRNFTAIGVPKAERVEPLRFDVYLTRAEWLLGCEVPIEVPLFHRGREGWIQEERPVVVRIPPQLPSGTVLEAALPEIANLYLRIQVWAQT
jgi:hypothetical protein